MKARTFSSFLRDLSHVGRAFDSDEAADLLRELAATLDALKGNPTVTSAIRQLADTDATNFPYGTAEIRRIIEILLNFERLLIVAGKKSYVTDLAALRTVLAARAGLSATDLLAKSPSRKLSSRLSVKSALVPTDLRLSAR